MRSTPRPKANPEYFFASILTHSKTFGWTSPAPPISISRVFLQIEHPVVQNGHEISISIPGSTNGK